MADDTNTGTVVADAVATDTTAADTAVADSAKVTADAAEKADAEKKAADARAALHTPPADGKYTLTVPKDSPLDASLIERTAATARALGLSNDAAQQLVESTHAEVLQVLTAEHAAFEAQAAEWKQSVLANPAYGKTPEERTAAIDKGRQVIDVHFAKVDPDGAKALKGFLDATLYGNHPAVVSLMHWLGQQGAEGPLHLGTGNGGDGKPKSTAQLMYGDQAGKPGAAAT